MFHAHCYEDFFLTILQFPDITRFPGFPQKVAALWHQQLWPSELKVYTVSETRRRAWWVHPSRWSPVSCPGRQHATTWSLAWHWNRQRQSDHQLSTDNNHRHHPIIQSRRIILFGHTACMDDNADAMPRKSCQPPLQWSGEENHDVPTSRGSAPSNRIWDTAT